MCDEDILQIFFEDLNQDISPLNQLPLYKPSKSAAVTDINMCRLSIKISSAWPYEDGTNGFTQNIRIELSLYSAHKPTKEHVKWWKINMFCDITSENV
jgi:hypothetical protein